MPAGRAPPLSGRCAGPAAGFSFLEEIKGPRRAPGDGTGAPGLKGRSP